MLFAFACEREVYLWHYTLAISLLIYAPDTATHRARIPYLCISLAAQMLTSWSSHVNVNKHCLICNLS